MSVILHYHSSVNQGIICILSDHVVGVKRNILRCGQVINTSVYKTFIFKHFTPGRQTPVFIMVLLYHVVQSFSGSRSPEIIKYVSCVMIALYMMYDYDENFGILDKNFDLLWIFI